MSCIVVDADLYRDLRNASKSSFAGHWAAQQKIQSMGCPVMPLKDARHEVSGYVVSVRRKWFAKEVIIKWRRAT